MPKQTQTSAKKFGHFDSYQGTAFQPCR